jgi:hypothetical protein
LIQSAIKIQSAWQAGGAKNLALLTVRRLHISFASPNVFNLFSVKRNRHHLVTVGSLDKYTVLPSSTVCAKQLSNNLRKVWQISLVRSLDVTVSGISLDRIGHRRFIKYPRLVMGSRNTRWKESYENKLQVVTRPA